MNYLSHQYVARRVHPEVDAPALFFAGNFLPDLLSVSGDGKLRTVDGHTGDLAEGALLHLLTDTHFHACAAFKGAQDVANALLVAASWETPLRRRFFVAHVLVELALDAYVLSRFPDLLDDVYIKLRQALQQDLIGETEKILQQPAPHLAATVEQFIEHPFLGDYATPEGCALALRRVCRRAHVPNFENDADFATLGNVYRDITPLLAPFIEELLAVPTGFTGESDANPVVQ